MRRGRVLLVDDQPSILASYSRTLADGGFAVTKAAGAAEALRRLEASSFDVVLTDILLPKKSGLGLLEEIHALSPNVPVIVMFDELDNASSVEAAELGALQSLVKPIDRALLKRTVGNAVRFGRAQQDRTSKTFARPGDPLTPVRITATDAKNQMGHVLDLVTQGGVVLITRHETPKAAVIPMAEYEKLSRASESKLSALSTEFDALFTRLQAPKARAGMQKAFGASPEQLAKVAVAFARKRG